MTNQQHPIIPPPELVQSWYEDKTDYFIDMIRAAQWGSDQELDACCEWLASKVMSERKYPELRAARRPKPPSLKEQALALLDPSNTYGSITREEEYRISIANAETIRRALEQLPE